MYLISRNKLSYCGVNHSMNNKQNILNSWSDYLIVCKKSLGLCKRTHRISIASNESLGSDSIDGRILKLVPSAIHSHANHQFVLTRAISPPVGCRPLLRYFKKINKCLSPRNTDIFFSEMQSGAEIRNTYHVQLSRIPSFGLGPEQRAVVSCLGLPSTVEVVRHQVDEVHISTVYHWLNITPSSTNRLGQVFILMITKRIHAEICTSDQNVSL